MKCWSRRSAKIIKNFGQYVVELFSDECGFAKISLVVY